MGMFPVFGAEDSRGISGRGSLLRSVDDLVGGVGGAEAGVLGRLILLEATIFAISAVPEEVNAEAREYPAACSWEGEMKWVT